MRISVTEARRLLAELIRRAEAGDEVVLTRHGHPAVRLVPITPVESIKGRRAVIEAARAGAAAKVADGPSTARCQDFLYDDTGLPH
jgi:prevent-host-death family protein